MAGCCRTGGWSGTWRWCLGSGGILIRPRAPAPRSISSGCPADRFAARRPRELSGGQRQRVAVARALAASPGLVLLDEPFGALDALTRAELRATFTELHRRLGFTALVVTHDLIEALMLGDRVGVMRAGRLEQLATPAELRSRPATPYVEALLAAGLPA